MWALCQVMADELGAEAAAQEPGSEAAMMYVAMIDGLARHCALLKLSTTIGFRSSEELNRRRVEIGGGKEVLTTIAAQLTAIGAAPTPVGSRAALVQLRARRAERVAAESGAFPPEHWVVLRLLSSIAITGVATIAAANESPHPAAGVIVGVCVGTLLLVENVARDISDLQGGVYEGARYFDDSIARLIKRLEGETRKRLADKDASAL